MATTKQSLELELLVKSEGFKGKLLEAQKNLLELEKKALKAGKANETLGRKIKQAKVQVKQARNEYNLATNALKQHAVQARATAKATVKLGAGQKKSNMAMTQAAYALDDMQYGFQGVQNNIQAMAVSMGAGGPLIVGLTLLTIGVGLMVKKFQKAGKEARKLKEELSEKQGLVASMMVAAEVIKNTTEGTEAHTKAMKQLTDNGYIPAKQKVDEYVAALQEQMFLEAKLAANKKSIQDNLVEQLEVQEKINKLTKDGPAKRASSAGSGVMGGGAQLNQNDLNFQHETKLSGAKEELKVLQEQLAEKLKISVEDRRQLEAIRVRGKKSNELSKESGKKDGALYSHGFIKSLKGSDVSSIYFKSLNDGIKNTLELQKAQGMGKEDLLRSELQILEASNMQSFALEDQEEIIHRIAVLKAKIANLPPMELLKDTGVGLSPDDKLFENFKSDLAIIKQLFDEGTITFDEWMSRVENLTAAFAKIDAATNATTENTQLFASAFIGAFESAATQGGAFLENLARGLMSALGSILIQQGTAAIMSGIAKNAIIPGSGKPAIVKGSLVVGAGVALKAGSSIGKRSAGAGGGGGGGSSSGGSSSPGSVVRPNPVRENARNRGSNLIIPMDRMRFGMQGADDNYSGFN